MDPSKVKCLECDRLFGQITLSHLKHHNMTLASYKEKFPGMPIISENVSKKLSETGSKPRTEEHQAALTASIRKGFENGRVTANKGVKGVVKASEETKAKQREARKGYKHSQETKDKIGNANRGSKRTPEQIVAMRKRSLALFEKNGRVGHMLGFKHSETTRKKISDSAKTRSPEHYKNQIKALAAARRKWVPTQQQRDNYRTARVKFMLENPDKVGIKYFDTKPELEFEAELKKAGIDYQKQFHTSYPHYLYDFRVGNDVIEIDGPYHYKESVHPNTESFMKQIEKDKVKTKVIQNLGMNLYRIQVVNNLPPDWRDVLKQQGCQLFE